MKETKAQENLKKALQDRERSEPAETATERRGPTQEEVDEANERRREIKKVIEEFRKSSGSDEDLEKVLNRHFDNLESERSEPTSPADSGRTLERGTRAVNMYTPEYRGAEIHSGDELRGAMKRDVPGMLEHRDIDDMMKQADAHFKAQERFKDRETVSAKEIAEFAKEVDEPEPTVRSWVAKGAEPRIYGTLDSALTKDEAKAKIAKVREGLGGVDSFDELQKRLDHPHHEKTRKHVSYPKDFESSRKYFDFLNEMEKGGTISDVSQRADIKQSTGSRYLEGRRTRLLKKAMEPIPSHDVKESRERVRLDSPKKYREALERNPFVKDHPDFKKLDHEARIYTEIIDLKKRGELPDKMVKDFAEEHKVGKQQLASWLSERKTQELIRNLEIYDKARATHESKLRPEAFEHRIDPSKVYEHFRHLREVKDPTTDQLAEAIENMYRKSELTSRVQWGELRPYHGGGPKWLREIAQSIHDQRSDVEAALNRRMGLDTDPDARLRLGVLDSKLYIRREDTSQWNWMDIYKNEAFYFKSLDQKNQLVDEAKARLDIQGGTRYSKLVDQLTDSERKKLSSQPNNDLYRTTHHLRGESLNLTLDGSNRSIQEIQDRIERIGQGKNEIGGISNPKFPANMKEVESMFTSALGAGLSDGHIERSNDGFVYAESNRKRVDIFNKQVDRFGDVYRSEDIRPNGVIRTRYASAFGRALEKRGLTSGDKSLQNEGFPDWLKNASPEGKRKYYGPLWAQDGNFYIDPDGHARFQWDRGVVLRDPSKAAKYELDHHATKEHADLVREFGTPKESAGFEGLYDLSHGRLKELKSHHDERVARTAQSLHDIAVSTESKLLEDEMEGLGSLGIKTKPYLRQLTYSEKSGRLSTLWHATTATKDDAMRTGSLCPPEDFRKHSDVREWMRSDNDRRERVKNQLRKEGLLKGDELDGI